MRRITLFIFLAVAVLFSGCFKDDNPNDDDDKPIESIFDKSFDVDGIVVHNNAAGGNDNDSGEAIALDSNGNVYVTGYSNNGSNRDMVIWKYKPDGTLDTSFGTDGIVTHNNAAGGNDNDSGKAIVLDSNGNIYVTGYSKRNDLDQDMAIWKYKPDGTLDTSFSTDGIVVHSNAAGGNGNDSGYDIIIDSNGNIYVTGTSQGTGGSGSDMVIWKYKSDGTLDTSFSINGIVTHHNAAGGSYYDGGYGIKLDSNGNIYVAGFSSNGSNNDMVIWKYKPDGTLDTSFGTDGIVVYHNAAGGDDDDCGKSMVLDSDDNLYVTGYSDNSSNNEDMVIWKYKSDGTLDTSFNADGIVVYDNAAGASGRYDNGKDIILDSNGNIYVTGYSNNGMNNDMVAWKYKLDGTLDTSFDKDGIIVHHNAAGGNSIDSGLAIAIDSNDSIYIAGYSYNNSNTDAVIWKYK